MGLTSEQYRDQLQALLPRGAAWTRAPKAVLTKVLEASAQELARFDQRVESLVAEAAPSTTAELLSDWERVAGLPDNCEGVLSSTQQARSQSLVSKLSSVGGQSADYFSKVAADLGFEVQIEEHRAYAAGVSCAGDPLCDDSWVHAWVVRSPEITEQPFAAGEGAAGEPLSTWGNDELECRIRQLSPAHTKVMFAYGPVNAGVLLLDQGDVLYVDADAGLLLG